MVLFGIDVDVAVAYCSVSKDSRRAIEWALGYRLTLVNWVS